MAGVGAVRKGKRELRKLDNTTAIIVPGGFGSRGIEGKLAAIRYCRENKIPYLGLCYGMQLAVVEFARDVLKLRGANTTEIDPRTKYPVIHILPEQEEAYGGEELRRDDAFGRVSRGAPRGTIAVEAYGRTRSPSGTGIATK